ncbi:hypothetical protein ACVBIL_05945 [Shewanella sp. 125m-7]
MFDFFLMLFFSKMILLTPDYVNINPGDYEFVIELNEPLSAITTGANVQVDVTESLPSFSEGDLIEVRGWISEMFPADSIEVTLRTESNREVKLNYTGNSSIGGGEARLLLFNANGELARGLKFNKLTISTNVKLERVKVYWKNHWK